LRHSSAIIKRRELLINAYHDGMYVPEGRLVAHKEAPLLLLLHWADMWTASVKEKKGQTNMSI